MSNFEQVREFHQVFDHPIATKPDRNIFTKNEKLVNLRVALIEEEFNELKEAISNHDMKEVADALTDMLYVIYGAGHSFGIDLDRAFKLVHASNMTKACSTLEEAEETVSHLLKEGRYRDPAISKSQCGKYYIVYDRKTGKILKNKYYKPVDLTPVL